LFYKNKTSNNGKKRLYRESRTKWRSHPNFGCMQSCSKDSDMTSSPNTGGTGGTSGGGTANTKIDFTIDISTTPYDVLKKEGGYIVYAAAKVIIARITASELIAVSSQCTHQGETLEYKTSTSKFYCPLHGSNFNQTGSVANGPATAALKQYKTSLDGNKLRVYE
jgi:cytochrome b6-f complex iron-sulfur subunit